MTDYTLEKLQADLAGSDWPELRDWQWQDAAVELNLLISEDISWFAGHFPQQAVLPGVVQTHWAAELAKKLFPVKGPFQRINNLKFKTMIMPGTELVLQLKYNAEKQAIAFSYHDSEQEFSTASLVFS